MVEAWYDPTFQLTAGQDCYTVENVDCLPDKVNFSMTWFSSPPFLFKFKDSVSCGIDWVFPLAFLYKFVFKYINLKIY